MILFEFEGKELFKKYGINIPKSSLVTSLSQRVNIKPPAIVKAQVLSGKRKDAGGIVEVKDVSELKSAITKILGKVINNEKVSSLLVEEKASFEKEYYISASFDTSSRSPIITFSESGGTGIEGRKSQVFPVDAITLQPKYPKTVKMPAYIKTFINKVVSLFMEEDATLVEINPLIIENGKPVALDAKIKLDDNAFGRHKDRAFSSRAVPGHIPTKNEIAAKKIDENDYRGTAGSTYFDLPGDIAVLASGGGASLTAMDALIAAGGRPANYTEYSGNPPKEKVEKLTQIVLSKDNIHGLWVVGAIANFTNIYETLSGFLEALRKIKPRPGFPIVIRRGGPHDKEAFDMLRKVKDFNLHLYGEEISITKSAEIMAKLAKKYASTT